MKPSIRQGDEEWLVQFVVAETPISAWAFVLIARPKVIFDLVGERCFNIGGTALDPSSLASGGELAWISNVDGSGFGVRANTPQVASGNIFDGKKGVIRRCIAGKCEARGHHWAGARFHGQTGGF